MKSVINILEEYGYHSYLFDEIESTSRFLINTIRKQNTGKVFCLANNQTSGYGQRGRSWLSDRSSLTFSFGVPLVCEPDELFGRGLALALAVRKVLSCYHDESLMVKWPNDVYSSKGKISGILTEVIKSSNSQPFVVIGIGINVFSSPVVFEANSDCVFDLTLEAVLEGVLPVVERLYSLNLLDAEATLKEWSLKDYFKIGDRIVVESGKSRSLGVYMGLSGNFMPLIKEENGMMEYRFGNVSLKRVIG